MPMAGRRCIMPRRMAAMRNLSSSSPRSALGMHDIRDLCDCVGSGLEQRAARQQEGKKIDVKLRTWAKSRCCSS